MKYLLLTLLIATSLQIYPQVHSTINLAGLPDTVRMQIDSKKNYVVEISNKLPYNVYTIYVNSQIEAIPEINIEDYISEQDSSIQLLESCQAKEIVEKIKNVKSESNIPQLIVEAQEIIDQNSLATCSTEEIETIQNWLERLKTTINIGNISKNQTVEINISRKDLKTNNTIRWVYILSAPKLGSWRSSFGFTYIGQTFSKEDRYYLEKSDSSFVITEKNNNKELDFVPSVVFRWVPEHKKNAKLSLSIVGGLGLDDLTSPIVMLGGGATYFANLSADIGIVFHQQNKLRGNYSPNQILIETRSEDEIHEQLYRINSFASISYRFKQNPFNKAKSE